MSYEHVMTVRKYFAKAVSKRWSEDGVVVPTNIKRGVFVTSATDNLDESGRFEFHGTAITLTSHPTRENMGHDPPPLKLDIPEGSTIHIPDDFANVPHVDELAGDITLTPIPNGTARPHQDVHSLFSEESWLSHLYKVVVENGGQLQNIPVTYSGFFSHNQHVENIRPRATVGIFPIFYEKASSMSMQKHAMLVVKRATEFVNPDQTPL